MLEKRVVNISKRITISIDDVEYNSIVGNYGGANKSAFIRQMIRRGLDVDSNDFDSYKIKNHKLTQEIYEKNEEIKKLKAELGRIQARITPQRTLDIEENTPFNDQELTEFKANLEKDKNLKRWFSKCVDLTIRNPEFREGRYNLYKNEIDNYIKPSGFFLLLNMATELRKRGEL